VNHLISIVIPTKNEEQNIGKLLDLISVNVAIPYEVIVSDDSNNNLTAALALTKGARVIDGEKKSLAFAVAKGIRESKGDIVIVMDADLQHPPELLPKMIEQLNYHDLVVVTKHTKDSAADFSWWRKLQSHLGVMAARMLVPISDPMTGYFGIRKKCLEEIVLNAIGFKIGLEIFCKANWTSHVEIPMHFKNRMNGQSKGTANSLHKHLWQLYKSSLEYKLLLPAGSEEWYAFYEGNNFRRKWKQAIAKAIKRTAEEANPLLSLDVGCGSSPNINYIPGKRMGIDIRPDCLDFIKEHSDAEFRQGNILNIPFPENAFDLVTCIEVIEHLHENEVNVAISELARVTKQNGYIIIATPNYDSLLWKSIERLQQLLQPRSWVNDHYTKLNRIRLDKIAKKHGLKEERYETVAKGCDMIVTYIKT